MNEYINNSFLFNQMINNYIDTLSYYGYRLSLDKHSKYFEIFDNRFLNVNPVIKINFVNPVGKYRIYYPMDVSIVLFNMTKRFAKHLQKFEKQHPDVVKIE